MCVWGEEHYFVADVKDFSLIYALKNVHIISRFCCFQISHTTEKAILTGC